MLPFVCRNRRRLLRAGDKKKRLKRKTKPSYRQIWFSAAGILAVLLGLGGIVYLATRPPSAKGLFQQRWTCPAITSFSWLESPRP